MSKCFFSSFFFLFFSFLNFCILFSQHEAVMNNSFVLVFAIDECKGKCFLILCFAFSNEAVMNNSFDFYVFVFAGDECTSKSSFL
jgi:hypothetical protein